jgi:tetratricopeptide (TPR) repeat protein
MMNKGLKLAVAAVVFGTFLSGAVFTVSAQKPKSKEEAEARIRELEKEKQRIQLQQVKADQKADPNRPHGAKLEKLITEHERHLDGCAVKKSDRCAEVMYTLGSLYYDQAMERFDLATKQYERAGRQGKPPVPDYSKSTRMFWQLSREYPNFPKLPEAYFQMSQNYLVAGHLDTARVILEHLVKLFPSSTRASAAKSRLIEIDKIEPEAAKARQAAKEAEQVRRAEQVKQAEEARQAEEAAKAAFDAMPTVPAGTGYDKVPWGASVESVRNVYRDLTVIDKDGDMIKLGHKNVGKGIEERKFRFFQDKLITVTVSYGLMTGEGVGLLIEKITSIYGKPVSSIKKNASIIHTWEYNKKTKITFTNFDIVSAWMELERLSYPDRQQAPVGVVKAMTPIDGAVDIEYEDMPAVEQLQKENTERAKKKAEDDKKKRSDGLGL